MISVKSSPSTVAINNSSLKVWQDCVSDKDRVIFRDGSKLEDPVLLVYCGGSLPAIKARGPTMLVEFRSSSLAIPLGASALKVELDAQVMYVDSDGLDYARGPQGCHFFINATAKRSGNLRAPLHALPPNSTCTWNIKGNLGDRVWLYFSSYSQRDLTTPTDIGDSNGNNTALTETICVIKITFWDGAPITGLPMSVLCDNTPKLCAHAALRNTTRTTRPCTDEESYLTIAPSLTIRMEAGLGTALYNVNFHVRKMETQEKLLMYWKYQRVKFSTAIITFVTPL